MFDRGPNYHGGGLHVRAPAPPLGPIPGFFYRIGTLDENDS